MICRRGKATSHIVYIPVEFFKFSRDKPIRVDRQGTALQNGGINCETLTFDITLLRIFELVEFLFFRR